MTTDGEGTVPDSDGGDGPFLTGVFDPDAVRAKYLAERDKRLFEGRADIRDLTGDDVVDQRDLRMWVHELSQTWFGDTNLDGLFSSDDLVAILAAGEYEDNVGQNSRWSTGDWNADLEVDSADLVFALADGGYEAGPRPAAVPEPSAFAALLTGLIAAASVLGTRRKLSLIDEAPELPPCFRDRSGVARIPWL